MSDDPLWLEIKSTAVPIGKGGGKTGVIDEIAGNLLPQKKHISQKRLLRGQYHPQATFDMHGLPANQAFELLLQFLNVAKENQNHLVLIITGKGNNSQSDAITLKQHFIKWMSLPQFTSHVAWFTESAPKHGGSGAYYVGIRMSDNE